MKYLVALSVSLLWAVNAMGQDLPKLRVAVLEIGTVNWELKTIQRLGLDRENGFELVVDGYAGGDATRIALQGGEADVIVADWIWTARQRAAGRGLVTFPYSTAVGGLVVPADSDVETLADLEGRKIGIAGGPLDKSWLILRAYAQQQYGMDLAGTTEHVYGAPPLIYRAGLTAEVDGVINFWHFLARMRASGMRQVISVAEASTALGLDPSVPLLGYVMMDGFVAENRDIVTGFYAASRAAKAVLASDDEAWEALRGSMRFDDEAQFTALREDWRAGIPAPGNVNVTDAAAFLAVMADLGGEALVGDATTVPSGLFLQVE